MVFNDALGHVVHLCSILFFRLISLFFTFNRKLFLMVAVANENGNLSEKAYKKITSVLLSFNALNVHEPKNDLNIKGPFVILTAVTFGRI